MSHEPVLDCTTLVVVWDVEVVVARIVVDRVVVVVTLVVEVVVGAAVVTTVPAVAPPHVEQFLT